MPTGIYLHRRKPLLAKHCPCGRAFTPDKPTRVYHAITCPALRERNRAILRASHAAAIRASAERIYERQWQAVETMLETMPTRFSRHGLIRFLVPLLAAEYQRGRNVGNKARARKAKAA